MNDFTLNKRSATVEKAVTYRAWCRHDCSSGSNFYRVRSKLFALLRALPEYWLKFLRRKLGQTLRRSLILRVIPYPIVHLSAKLCIPFAAATNLETMKYFKRLVFSQKCFDDSVSFQFRFGSVVGQCSRSCMTSVWSSFKYVDQSGPCISDFSFPFSEMFLAFPSIVLFLTEYNNIYFYRTRISVFELLMILRNKELSIHEI